MTHIRLIDQFGVVVHMIDHMCFFFINLAETFWFKVAVVVVLQLYALIHGIIFHKIISSLVSP